jgi:hypothetical protein
MKHTILFAALLLGIVSTGCHAFKHYADMRIRRYYDKYGIIIDPNPRRYINVDAYSPGIHVNAYGPGIHADQYGRAVKFEVQGQRNTNYQHLQIKENAYGLGVHSDQYGRPVRAVPAYR